jgi:hypothetical protein
MNKEIENIKNFSKYRNSISEIKGSANKLAKIQEYFDEQYSKNSGSQFVKKVKYESPLNKKMKLVERSN